jgi:SNF2 family DNA or RNA helicase
MMEPSIDTILQRCRLPPFDHQRIGVEKIVQQPFFLLADEMGAGKTKQAIDAAQVLFYLDRIDKAIVICPAPVRGVWFHRQRGELNKHLWLDTSSRVVEYHRNVDVWDWGLTQGKHLDWIVTNYDYIRRAEYEEELIAECTPRTLLILDESSAVKNSKAQQSKAVLRIRNKCGRVLLLNGTPIANSPADMYMQGRIMHKDILGLGSFSQFRARYALMGGWQGKQIIGWRDLEDLQKRFAPYVLRRLKQDCLDLPEKLPPVLYEVPLTAATWKIYRDMRDELVVWLDSQSVSVAAQAIVKVIRLAQITSGLLGGVEFEDLGPILEVPDYLTIEDKQWVPEVVEAAWKRPEPLQHISREKLDALLEKIEGALYEKPNHKFIVWCRFKPEAVKTVETIRDRFPRVTARLLYGSQSKAERDAALALLDPATTVPGPACAVATMGTGSIGLTLTAADTNYYLSLTRMLLHLLQSIDRTHRPTQVNPVSYYYFLATGPKGQRTIDHILYEQLEQKNDLATMTCSAWVKALTEE